MRLSGVTQKEVGDAIGYSGGQINHQLSGRYPVVSKVRDGIITRCRRRQEYRRDERPFEFRRWLLAGQERLPVTCYPNPIPLGTSFQYDKKLDERKQQFIPKLIGALIGACVTGHGTPAFSILLRDGTTWLIRTGRPHRRGYRQFSSVWTLADHVLLVGIQDDDRDLMNADLYLLSRDEASSLVSPTAEIYAPIGGHSSDWSGWPGRDLRPFRVTLWSLQERCAAERCSHQALQFPGAPRSSVDPGWPNTLPPLIAPGDIAPKLRYLISHTTGTAAPRTAADRHPEERLLWLLAEEAFLELVYPESATLGERYRELLAKALQRPWHTIVNRARVIGVRQDQPTPRGRTPRQEYEDVFGTLKEAIADRDGHADACQAIDEIQRALRVSDHVDMPLDPQTGEFTPYWRSPGVARGAVG
jgi:hypothetical protein